MSVEQGEAFGPWLGRQLRRATISQAELAKRLGITRAAVSAWIVGRAEPRDEHKRMIAEILGIDPEAVTNRTSDVSTNLPLTWHHRPAHADGGREYGNAAAFAFNADLSVLAREATQNSLDERHDLTRPVQVHYTLHEISGPHLDKFLDTLRWNELREHYDAAAGKNQKVSRSLKAALEELDRTRTTLLLRVDDYNAAGLTGPEYSDGRFAAVVRRQLDSHKESSRRAGGSYGLGKVTLWATSKFGLVMMNSTLSEPHEGRTERRVIGRLDLPWRTVDDEAYAGPAWFGEPDTSLEHPKVSRSWWADEETVRDLHLERPHSDAGTSFLIVGAYDASGDAASLQDMHEKLVRSLADGFWAAMVGGQRAGALLDARVTTMRNGQVLVPEQRVDPYSRHPALSRALKAYLDNDTVPERTSGDQVAQTDVPLFVTPLLNAPRVEGKGTEHRAVLLLTATDDEERKNRVVCMRGNRMTIMERRPRELPLGTDSFQAVLLAGHATENDGDDVQLAEDFLRASEPPEHNKWDRTEELTSLYRRGALSRIDDFKEEIDRAVRELVGRRETVTRGGPAVLQELLRLNSGGVSTGTRRAQGVPTVRSINARLDDTGAWHVDVDLKLPEAEDSWLLTPVAKFDVRSGGRPAVEWSLLTAADNCQVENGNLVIPAGTRSASFAGVTDPASHPVRGKLSRLLVDVQKARGGAR
ncbi:DNA-binding transcriptional regulator, XRE-family HTH domain [Lentzea albidocapillata subsp. violacea]|uniref:DNA-binding transcriptional regulator, XRE-family HTH domain n=1 Tax=Lentzea albidocapillata subsp. violacea TaxID=128104 RepID=A0A1G8XJ60_9PSEU|nr:helix-turn-helix transcriptional regulator [Lentzea albidocapillata]SDJ89945.1 DNA-binding transcriptional regulator, XRE-family HTH domain [Lentzea albidocapillata subsp. violacea]